MPPPKPAARPGLIAKNRRARFDFHLAEAFEAGLALTGWEVQSLRAGAGQLTDSYVVVRGGEAWLLGAHISPLASASTHVDPDPTRTRKLLLHRREISRIATAVERKGHTCVATKLYWKDNRVKCEVALGRGKQQRDKRATTKDRDWKRAQERLLKRGA